MENIKNTPYLKRLLTLALTFLKIGAFTFGGGYAMIPLIEAEIVEKHKWLSGNDMLEIIAIAESTPGPIAINSATFVGYRVCGVFGSFVATLGVVLPSFLIISVISFIIDKFKDNTAVKYAFYGIRAGVLALIFKALLTMYKRVNKNAFSYILMALSFVCAAFLKVPVLLIIITCAVLGMVYTLFVGGRKK